MNTKLLITSGAALVALTLAGCQHDLNNDEMMRAELGARSYAQITGADFASCSGLDSDDDGYTTCVIQPKAGGEPREIVCSYRAKGCKAK